MWWSRIGLFTGWNLNGSGLDAAGSLVQLLQAKEGDSGILDEEVVLIWLRQYFRCEKLNSGGRRQDLLFVYEQCRGQRETDSALLSVFWAGVGRTVPL